MIDLTISERILNYIGGQFTVPVGDNYLDNVNPATGEVFCQIPDSNSADVDAAVEAARAAFPKWSVTPAEENFGYLIASQH
jgi:aminomuconate-semialdehyde/2-hydroxymuconate-6-semialdehyde dehydrogenase